MAGGGGILTDDGSNRTETRLGHTSIDSVKLMIQGIIIVKSSVTLKSDMRHEDVEA